MAFILFLLAVVLWLPLTAINFTVVMFTGWKKRGFFRYKSRYFTETAIDIDRFGNRNLRTLLNLTLRKNEGYRFGDERETISSVLGKNQRDRTLTTTGRILCFVLDSLDKNHCLKSINPLNTY